MPKVNFVQVMTYSQAFGPPPPACPFDLLRDYPTDMILLCISKINAIIYIEEEILVRNSRILQEVVFEGLPELAKQTLGRTEKSLFTGPVMSLIIKDALENYVPFSEGITINPAPFADKIFKAILAYNEHYYADEHIAEWETFEGLFTVDIRQQYYLRGERYLKLDMLLKFAFLGKFLSDDDRLKNSVLEYCQILDISTIWGLAQFFLRLFMQLLSREKIAKHILDITAVQWPVLKQFVVRKSELTNPIKLSLHKQIITKPFYQVDEGHLLLLDYNYFNYGLDQGFLFSIYQNSSLKTGGIFKNYNDYKSHIGLRYFEQYFIGGFIRSIFSKWNNRIVSTEKYQDYIVRAGNNVFAFEVKMTEFNANGLDKESFMDFKNFIDQNFLGPKKGVQQLIRQISYLAEDPKLKYLLGINDFRKINVYPIIIYSDPILDMHGINEYVNETLLQEIAPYLLRFQHIRPVTMVNGSFLMNYYHLLRKDPALFGQWLNDYLKGVNNLKKRYQAYKQPVDYLLYNKSFAEHMRCKLTNQDRDLNLAAIASNFELDIKDFGNDIPKE